MNKSWRNVVIGEDNSVSGSTSSAAVGSTGSRTGAGNSSNGPSTGAGNSSNAANGTSTGPSVLASSSSSNSGAKIPVAAENDAKRHERLLIVYAPLVSQRVTVFLYDGAVFEGTLDSFETEKSKNEFALILRMATMLRPGREVIDASIKAGITFELMNIRFDDMAELKSNSNSSSSSSKTGGIGTDAAISKKKGDFGKERELHRWLPDGGAGGGSPLPLPTLAAASNPPGPGSWDQFATNEKLFGLKTDFNEEMYTTKLDRTSAHIKAHEAKAERIAKEIMLASSGGNAHMAEERGHEVGEGDEEMLYGAVIRGPASALPPGFSAGTASSLNPSAPEFKLNVDAPEFNPNRVTYYNQPRHNLMNMTYSNPSNMNNNGYYGGYSGGYGGGYGGYPHQVPYYYVPPLAVEPTTVFIAASNNTSSASSATAPSTTSAMNPNAADFVMPQPQYEPQYQQTQYQQPQYQYQYQYQQPQYYQQQQPPYYSGSGYNSNNNNNNNNNYYNQ